MRRILIFCIPFFLMSCSGNKADTMTNESSDKTFFMSTIESAEISSESLVEKKFKEFYNLNMLLTAYPDFKKDIEQRIKDFTSGEKAIFERDDSIQIANIRQSGALIKESDSLERTYILFDVIRQTETKTDSVLVLITKKNVNIDGESITSTKVKFARDTGKNH